MIRIDMEMPGNCANCPLLGKVTPEVIRPTYVCRVCVNEEAGDWSHAGQTAGFLPVARGG